MSNEKRHTPGLATNLVKIDAVGKIQTDLPPLSQRYLIPV